MLVPDYNWAVHVFKVNDKGTRAVSTNSEMLMTTQSYKKILDSYIECFGELES